MNIDLQYYNNTIPNHMINKLDNDEKIYVKNATYISKWINILNTDNEFNYERWANDDDIKIMAKLLT